MTDKFSAIFKSSVMTWSAGSYLNEKLEQEQSEGLSLRSLSDSAIHFVSEYFGYNRFSIGKGNNSNRLIFGKMVEFLLL